MEKVELGSSAWMALLEDRLSAYAARTPEDLRLSLCEVFTGVPAHLDSRGDGTLVWSCVIEDRRAAFSPSELPDADLFSRADYDFILPVARWIYTPEVMGEVEAYKADGVASGKYRPGGRDPTKVPAFFREMHNELARRTL